MTAGSAAQSTDIVIDNTRGKTLDNIVHNFTNDNDEPFWGTVLVAHDGNVILSNGYGFADLDDEAMTPRHLFDVGSIAKQFTAAAIFRLEMDGLLSIDDPITRYLEPTDEQTLGNEAATTADNTPITIHHLLTHTSGIPDRMSFKGINLFECESTIEYILAHAVFAEPGERFAYNNIGYFLLAAIIEEASGQTFEHYLRTRLFEPAGMMQTGFVLDEVLDDSFETARIFPWRDGIFRSTTLKSSWNWANRGATGVVTTVRDLHQWYEALRHHRVLDAATTNRFFTTQHAGYAYGWYIEHTERGTVRAQHSGATRGYAAQYTIGIDESLVVAVLSNRDHDVRALARQLESALFPEKRPSIEATVFPRSIPELQHETSATLADDIAIDVRPVLSVPIDDAQAVPTGRIALRIVDRSRRETPIVLTMDAEGASRIANRITTSLAGVGHAGDLLRMRTPLLPGESGDTDISVDVFVQNFEPGSIDAFPMHAWNALQCAVITKKRNGPTHLVFFDVERAGDMLTITLPASSAARIAALLRSHSSTRTED